MDVGNGWTDIEMNYTWCSSWAQCRLNQSAFFFFFYKLWKAALILALQMQFSLEVHSICALHSLSLLSKKSIYLKITMIPKCTLQPLKMKPIFNHWFQLQALCSSDYYPYYEAGSRSWGILQVPWYFMLYLKGQQRHNSMMIGLSRLCFINPTLNLFQRSL